MLSFECPSVFFQCPEALSGSSGGRYTLLYITNGRRTGLLLIVRYHYNPLQRYAKRTEYQSLCLCFYEPMKSCLLLSCHLRINGTAGSAVSAHTANCMTVFTVSLLVLFMVLSVLVYAGWGRLCWVGLRKWMFVCVVSAHTGPSGFVRDFMVFPFSQCKVTTSGSGGRAIVYNSVRFRVQKK